MYGINYLALFKKKSFEMLKGQNVYLKPCRCLRHSFYPLKLLAPSPQVNNGSAHFGSSSSSPAVTNVAQLLIKQNHTAFRMDILSTD